MKTRLNKKIIAQNFSKAAAIYDNNSDVQKIAAYNLCNLALPFIRKDHKIIDLGCGTATLSKHLHGHNIVGLDLSLNMLKQNQNQQSICADIENLPIKNERFNIILSSFALQWMNDFEQCFGEFHRILKKDGIVIICVPVSESLWELKQTSHNLNCHFAFNDFPDITSLTNAFLKKNFAPQLLQEEVIKIQHENALSSLKSIKNIGATYNEKENKINKSAFKKFQKLDDSFISSWHLSYMIFQKH